jgi:Mg-chelatase subunit ChlD
MREIISKRVGGSSLLKQRLQTLSMATNTAAPTVVEMVRQVAGGRTVSVGTVLALLDTSASMSGVPLEQAKKGLTQFCDEALNLGYRVGVIAFESNPHEVVPATDDIGPLAAGIRELVTGGSTAMAEAIRLATSRLLALPPERLIFLVTDGQPDDRSETLSAAKAAHAAGIDLMTLGTETADHKFLQSIATRAELARQVAQVNLQAGIAQTAHLLLNAKGKGGSLHGGMEF